MSERFNNKGIYNHEKLVIFDNEAVTKQLLYEIRSEQVGGQHFANNIRVLAALMGQNWLYMHSPFVTSPPIIIGIPRGGTPMAEGVKKVSPESPLVFTDARGKQNPNRKLLPENSPKETRDIIICDTVVGTGNTIANTIQELKRSFPATNISLFSTVASEFSVGRLSDEFPNLEIYTACVEAKYEWVNRDGRQVFRTVSEMLEI